eukprot:351856-Chlamydomonas_euryale.AAC.6
MKGPQQTRQRVRPTSVACTVVAPDPPKADRRARLILSRSPAAAAADKRTWLSLNRSPATTGAEQGSQYSQIGWNVQPERLERVNPAEGGCPVAEGGGLEPRYTSW